MTTPYQIDASASIVTSPIIEAVSAMNAVSWICGLLPSNSNSGIRCSSLKGKEESTNGRVTGRAAGGLIGKEGGSGDAQAIRSVGGCSVGGRDGVARLGREHVEALHLPLCVCERGCFVDDEALADPDVVPRDPVVRE